MNRRQFLAAGLGASLNLQAQPPRKRVAAISTMQDHAFVSHAAVMVGRLLYGYSQNGIFTTPRTHVVSMCPAQTPANDLSRGLSEKHGFKI